MALAALSWGAFRRHGLGRLVRAAWLSCLLHGVGSAFSNSLFVESASLSFAGPAFSRFLVAS